MASGGKKKTTFSKLAREQKLRERRQDKQAKKDARKRNGLLDPATVGEPTSAEGDLEPVPAVGDLEPVPAALDQDPKPEVE